MSSRPLPVIGSHIYVGPSDTHFGGWATIASVNKNQYEEIWVTLLELGSQISLNFDYLMEHQERLKTDYPVRAHLEVPTSEVRINLLEDEVRTLRSLFQPPTTDPASARGELSPLLGEALRDAVDRGCDLHLADDDVAEVYGRLATLEASLAIRDAEITRLRAHKHTRAVGGDSLCPDSILLTEARDEIARLRALPPTLVQTVKELGEAVLEWRGATNQPTYFHQLEKRVNRIELELRNQAATWVTTEKKNG